MQASDPVSIRPPVRAVRQQGSAAVPAIEAREKVLQEAIWRGEELRTAADAVRAEITALQRELARAEETIAELTDIGDAAQLAIDRLRRDLRSAEQAAAGATAQRDVLAAELFALVKRAEELPSDRELVEQRDALAAELFRAARRTERCGFKSFWRRLFRAIQPSLR